jgi:AAA domain (dynein-related subfamily)
VVPITRDIFNDLKKKRKRAGRSEPLADQTKARRAEKETVPARGTQIRQDGLPLDLILYGPPGTGKTHKILKEYVPLFADGGERRYEMVTFHPSYSYEEFVEGLRLVVEQVGEEYTSGARTDMTTKGDARGASTVAPAYRRPCAKGIFC